MAMEINGSYGNYGLDYEEQLRAKRQEKAEEAEKAEKEREAGKNTDRIPEPRDEYISSEASDRKPTGLYRLGQDENGNPKVLYDDPKKPAREAEEKEFAEKKPVDADKAEDPGAAGEKCVGSTDRVDQENRRLKEQKKQLQQQIKSAAGDEEKVRQLQTELARVENELSQKDNDTYRKQNTVFTNV